MSAEINARREEGDLKENGGYHAAKDEQGKQEARIRQLTDLLRKATVGDAADEGHQRRDRHRDHREVRRGRRDGEVPPRFAGDRGHHRTRPSTRRSPPSARRSWAPQPGAKVTYQAPNGRDISVEVVGIEPFVP